MAQERERPVRALDTVLPPGVELVAEAVASEDMVAVQLAQHGRYMEINRPETSRAMAFRGIARKAGHLFFYSPQPGIQD